LDLLLGVLHALLGLLELPLQSFHVLWLKCSYAIVLASKVISKPCSYFTRKVTKSIVILTFLCLKK
jgi:hypothetical protein